MAGEIIDPCGTSQAKGLVVEMQILEVLLFRKGAVILAYWSLSSLSGDTTVTKVAKKAEN